MKASDSRNIQVYLYLIGHGFSRVGTDEVIYFGGKTLRDNRSFEKPTEIKVTCGVGFQPRKGDYRNFNRGWKSLPQDALLYRC